MSLSGLPAFAAAAQLQKSEVDITMNVVGLSGKKITDAIPDAGPYDVERHGEFMNAINKIKLLVYDSGVVVPPPKKNIDN